MEIDIAFAADQFVPRSALRDVYLEAVANAFDADASRIDISISSDGPAISDSLEITIADNGGGFTDSRFDRFQKLQTPADAYHKGVGRLVYPVYFDRVAVESYYDNHRRSFLFSSSRNGTSDVDVVHDVTPSGWARTTLTFTGFRKERVQKKEHLEPEQLKDTIKEHFLPLLHNKRKAGADFRITITTNVGDSEPDLLPSAATITPDDVPEFSERAIPFPDLGLFQDDHVRMSYYISPTGSRVRVLTALSVDGRTHEYKLIDDGAIPAGYSAIFLFESPVFVGRSDTSRQRLELPESIPEDALKAVLRREIGVVLAEELPEIEERNEETRAYFEDRFPHLTGLFEADTVGLISRNEALDAAQRRFFEEEKAVLGAETVDEQTYEKCLELSSRTLMEYIVYREVTIRKLRTIGATEPEAIIHNLIAPRFETYKGASLVEDVYRFNTWLLDDKFMSFRTTLSDEKLSDVIRAITLDDELIAEGGRPDIVMIFSADPEREEPVEVVVVEVKGRGADDRERSYVEYQLRQRAQKLARYCDNIQQMWYFGIVAMDEEYAGIMRVGGWKPMFTKGGHVLYQELMSERGDGERVPTPTYLLSYDAIIENAAARNQTFLEILKREMKRAQA